MEKRLFSHMLDGVVRDFGRPVILWQVAILVGALALAWLAARFAQRVLNRHQRARNRANSRANNRTNSWANSRANSRADNRVNSRADNQTDNQTDNQANNQIDSRTRNRVDNRASNGASNSTSSQASSGVSNQAGSEASNQAVHDPAHDQPHTPSRSQPHGQPRTGTRDQARAQVFTPASSQAPRHNAPTFGVESLHRAFFPLTGAGFVWIASEIVGAFTSMHTGLLDLAQVPLFGIGLIYIVFFFARRVFGRSKQMRAWLSVVEKLVSLVVWTGMALTVLGIQKDVLNWMDSVRFRIGSGPGHVTLLSLASGVLWVCVTMIVAVWAGTVLEERLMRASTIDANLKVVLARIGRALLVLAAVLVSLSLVGIDVTVLGVFGGALGVGLGFGLQKIASNYVSGFIILIDRSLHLGDAINVGGLQGKVTQIRTRYTVVRGLDGTETLVPNERLITDVVQNQSSYLTRGYAKAEVQVAYTTDLDLALKLLAQAASGVERVLGDPAPAPYLDSFGADGINLVLGYWIEDAASGTLRVRSTVNLNIWRLFNAHNISIPFTQREVRIIGVEGVAGVLPGGVEVSDGRSAGD